MKKILIRTQRHFGMSTDFILMNYFMIKQNSILSICQQGIIT